MKRTRWLSEVINGLFALVILAGIGYAAEIPNTSVFSQTDASNNTGTQPSWAEGMAPSAVNDAARALQGAVTRAWNWDHPTLSSTGSADAYVLTYSVAPAALYNGMRHCFEANFTNTGTATLNVNSLGAKTIQKVIAGVLTNLAANDIYSGDRVCVTYRSTGTVYVLESRGLQSAAVVTGPGSSTDNRVVRFDGVGGNVIQGSQYNIADGGNTLQYGAGGTIQHEIYAYDGASGAPGIIAYTNKHASDAFAFTAVTSGTGLFNLDIRGADGDQFHTAARIRCFVDTTPGDNDMPGRCGFYTTPDGSSTAVERLRVDSGHNIFAYKDDGANPGQVVAEHWVALTSDNTLTSAGTAQPLFDGGGGTANGRITVDTGIYFFQCAISVTSMSATSGNAAFTLAGTATYANPYMSVTGVDAAIGTPTASSTSSYNAVTTAASMVAAATGTAMTVEIKGSFDISAAGTIIPQITLVTAAAAVVEQGSYCRFHRGGNTGTATIGAWD